MMDSPRILIFSPRPSLTIGLNKLADLMRQQGEHAEVKDLLRLARTIHEATRGTLHPHTATVKATIRRISRVKACIVVVTSSCSCVTSARSGIISRPNTRCVLLLFPSTIDIFFNNWFAVSSWFLLLRVYLLIPLLHRLIPCPYLPFSTACLFPFCLLLLLFSAFSSSRYVYLFFCNLSFIWYCLTWKYPDVRSLMPFPFPPPPTKSHRLK